MPSPPGRLPTFPGSVEGRLRFPTFGRLPPSIPPLGNEGRLTGFTLPGGRTDGRFAAAEPPGRVDGVVGRATLGRPPPDGEKPPPEGRELLLGRETLPIEGRDGLGREVEGREGDGREGEGRLPPPGDGRPPPPPTCPMDGRAPPPPPRPRCASAISENTVTQAIATSNTRYDWQIVFMT